MVNNTTPPTNAPLIVFNGLVFDTQKKFARFRLFNFILIWAARLLLPVTLFGHIGLATQNCTFQNITFFPKRYKIDRQFAAMLEAARKEKLDQLNGKPLV